MFIEALKAALDDPLDGRADDPALACKPTINQEDWGELAVPLHY